MSYADEGVGYNPTGGVRCVRGIMAELRRLLMRALGICVLLLSIRRQVQRLVWLDQII